LKGVQEEKKRKEKAGGHPFSGRKTGKKGGRKKRTGAAARPRSCSSRVRTKSEKKKGEKAGA